MPVKILFLLFILLAYFVARSWLRSLNKEERKAAIWRLAVWAFAGIMLVAVATGKMHWLGLAFAALLGLLKFLVSAGLRYGPIFRSLSHGHQFSTPTFSTDYLRLKFDLSSMQLAGDILKGPNAGKTLAELSKDDLIELASFYRENCKSSYYLILATLRQSGTNHEGKESATYPGTSEPDINEAKDILGLGEDFSKEEVIAAHRRLLQKLHPDKGGSDYLASRVNLARTVLLNYLAARQ